MSVVALVTDLIFSTKIKGTADQLGVPLRIVRSEADLREAAEAAGSAGLVIIDLNAGGLDPVAAITVCKSPAAPPFVLAFLSHVQTELARTAQDAGADLVMPRSRFSNELPAILNKHCQSQNIKET